MKSASSNLPDQPVNGVTARVDWACDDRFDAFVLADTLRTDRARLMPLARDSEATIALRRTCRARTDLVGHRVAATNQLRAHLQNVFPGAVGLFADLDSPISLAFLARLTPPQPRSPSRGLTQGISLLLTTAEARFRRSQPRATLSTSGRHSLLRAQPAISPPGAAHDNSGR